jgi:hypothetical protein
MYAQIRFEDSSSDLEDGIAQNRCLTPNLQGVRPIGFVA